MEETKTNGEEALIDLAKLTFEEQAYCDEFSAVYRRYADKIPDDEWSRLSEIRKGLNVDLQKSRKIIKAVEFDSFKKKYLAQNPQMQLSRNITKVTEKDIVSKHDALKEQRNRQISELQAKKKQLEEYLQEQEKLEAPKKVEDPGALDFFKILISYAIGAWFIWYLDWFWIGVAVMVIETLVIFGHVSSIGEYEEYVKADNKYNSTKKRLKNGIPQLQVEIEILQTVISENLYSEINGGCAIPILKASINENTWNVLSGKLDELVRLYSEYKNVNDDEKVKRDKAMRFFDAKLQFFYDVSVRCEAGTSVFRVFDTQLKNAIASKNVYLLRKDPEESSLLQAKEYSFASKLEGFKASANRMDISRLMNQYNAVKDMDTSGFLGFANVDKLARKTENLQKVYAPIKDEYDRLRRLSNDINYYLTYARTVAYRNIYLGVELLNYIRDNAGGKSLMTQKDTVITNKAMVVGHVSGDALHMDSMENVANTLNGMLTDTLEDKQLRKFVMNNPKMAAGAAALAVVGNFLDERIDKINNNNEVQKQLITSIGQMVDGFNSGKAGMLRAVEVIKALSKANIGFLAIYAPLRDKFFIEGCTVATMRDLQNLAKATQEYKHISDTKL